LVQQWGSGLEGVDLCAALTRGIPVASVPASGSNAMSVAEHVILLILALLRQFPQAQANVREGLLGEPLGRTLAGRRVCLWGLGATALELAPRLRALGTTVLGLTRDATAQKARSFPLDECYSTQERALCLSRTDVLVLCVRLSEATRGMVESSTLSFLPRSAYLINAARGALIDYHALYAALSEGHLAGAALDVYWDEPIGIHDPILKLPNLLTTPHIAGVTDRSYGEIADAVAQNVERLRRGEPLLNQAL
jgi:phosphoglycerate dehydrogenase-like enzyme